MSKWLLIISAVLLVMLVAVSDKLIQTSKDLKTAEANIKAYNARLDSAERKSVAYQLTVNQMKYFQDSILQKLNNTREDLGIKDKNTNAVQYVVSTFERVDTLIINDTIFKEPSFAMDTIIGDKWYSADVSMRYPSTIMLKPSFKSEKHIVVHTKKETVNPPKKFFLFRWFQKKHKVLKVEVVEKNPYVKDEESVYYDILK